jgi:hypothetical protein
MAIPIKPPAIPDMTELALVLLLPLIDALNTLPVVVDII